MPPRSSSRTAPVPVKPAEPVIPNWLSLPVPSWVMPAIIGLAVVLLISLFTTESGDPDRSPRARSLPEPRRRRDHAVFSYERAAADARREGQATQPAN